MAVEVEFIEAEAVRAEVVAVEAVEADVVAAEVTEAEGSTKDVDCLCSAAGVATFLTLLAELVVTVDELRFIELGAGVEAEGDCDCTGPGAATGTPFEPREAVLDADPAGSGCKPSSFIMSGFSCFGLHRRQVHRAFSPVPTQSHNR